MIHSPEDMLRQLADVARDEERGYPVFANSISQLNETLGKYANTLDLREISRRDNFHNESSNGIGTFFDVILPMHLRKNMTETGRVAPNERLLQMVGALCANFRGPSQYARSHEDPALEGETVAESFPRMVNDIISTVKQHRDAIDLGDQDKIFTTLIDLKQSFGQIEHILDEVSDYLDEKAPTTGNRPTPQSFDLA
ncbi:MAG: hypothetical protein DI551_05940 [Micavibrio aeruginosavorus]|uniref:Uncharacterized protein n=1 Tax=Micavibrio aeruginosavorus TaxID=349221 RepID=A0A2W5N050_9BACT|nr:MAG: hypothetical protein DI551_05940 [Micavibrio aeruginosavorus]